MRLLILFAFVALACGAPIDEEAVAPDAPVEAPAPDAPAPDVGAPAPEAPALEAHAAEGPAEEAIPPEGAEGDPSQGVPPAEPVDIFPEEPAAPAPVVELPVETTPREPGFFEELLWALFGDDEEDVGIKHSSSPEPLPVTVVVEPFHVEGEAVFMRFGD